MPLSQATISAQNLDLAPSRVTFNGVDLGASLGNVAVSIKYSKADIKADQLGDTVINRVASGLNITVTTELAEILNKDIWKVVFPNAREVTSGSKLMQFIPQIALDDLSLSHALVLHPLNKADSDLTADLKFYKAVASAESEFVMGPSEQRKLKIVWNVYPDLGQSDYPFMIYGDPAVGLVAATAGTPAFTGTGNGTITGVTVFSGFTKTETITIKVVGVPGSNQANWSVTGSLSGALGIATNGVAFNSSVISFTINDGTTDFVLNDQFTIATTSSNYA